MVSVFDVIREFTLNSKIIGTNLVIALVIIVIGVLIGKFVKLVLSRILSRLRIERIFKFRSVDVGLTIIKWSVYLFFISFAIKQLKIPYLSDGFIDSLSIIPRSIGAFIVVVAGFLFGKYLKENIMQANKEWALLGDISFYFFLYLSFIISIQLVFFSEEFLINWVSLIFTAFFLLFLVLKNRK
ncbi:hypothetical protein J4442_02040 [Candidatus Woesearchaeota archaeon]|nr:hypothetical protein [Candidatus Woesearchaeota archaeon]